MARRRIHERGRSQPTPARFRMKNIGHNRREGIEVLTLARPPANALDIETTEELADAFEALASDDAAAAVVLTGEGKAFCAGLDLKAIPNYSQTELRRLLDAINRMATAVYSCPLPVIGAINGHAIAGGFVLAMCCDWKIVADAPMRVGLTEVRVGVPYPAAALEGGPQRASSEGRARAGTVRQEYECGRGACGRHLRRIGGTPSVAGACDGKGARGGGTAATLLQDNQAPTAAACSRSLPRCGLRRGRGVA